MAMLTLVEAARKTGLTTYPFPAPGEKVAATGPAVRRATPDVTDALAKAIRSGRLSASRKEDGSYEIDPAELALHHDRELKNSADDRPANL